MSYHLNQVKNIFLLITTINQISYNIVYSQSRYCYYMCDGYIPCIEQCLYGNHAIHGGYGSPGLYGGYGGYGSSHKHQIHSYAAAVASSGRSTPNKVPHAYQSVGGGGGDIDSPTHCGLRYRTQSRSRYNDLMGRIVGGMNRIYFESFS